MTSPTSFPALVLSGRELVGFTYFLMPASPFQPAQIHKVFQDSFDAKECYSEEFIFQKLNYIHHNPVSKNLQLIKDFTDYVYSIASFYEKGIKKYEKLVHIHDALHNQIPGFSYIQGPAVSTPGLPK